MPARETPATFDVAPPTTRQRFINKRPRPTTCSRTRCGFLRGVAIIVEAGLADTWICPSASLHPIPHLLASTNISWVDSTSQKLQRSKAMTRISWYERMNIRYDRVCGVTGTWRGTNLILVPLKMWMIWWLCLTFDYVLPFKYHANSYTWKYRSSPVT